MSENQTNEYQTKAKILTLDQVSAGGVAFRWMGSNPEVAIVSVKPKLRWQLPKGIVDPGEAPEDTAVREVREEAGVEMLAFKAERGVVEKAREMAGIARRQRHLFPYDLSLAVTFQIGIIAPICVTILNYRYCFYTCSALATSQGQASPLFLERRQPMERVHHSKTTLPRNAYSPGRASL